MAKKIKNALDFCRSSQRLFVATWSLIIFALVIIFLVSDSSAEITPLSLLPFFVLGLIAVIGSFACNKMLTNIHDGRKALKKSNQIHRCQSSIIVILFLFIAGMITVLLFLVFLYIMQDQSGDNPIYSIVNDGTDVNATIEPALLIKQKMISGMIQLAIGTAITVVYLVFYMKIVITCDIARKDFTNLPNDIEKDIKPKIAPKKEVESEKESDDSDDEEL